MQPSAIQPPIFQTMQTESSFVGPAEFEKGTWALQGEAEFMMMSFSRFMSVSVLLLLRSLSKVQSHLSFRVRQKPNMAFGSALAFWFCLHLHHLLPLRLTGKSRWLFLASSVGFKVFTPGIHSFLTVACTCWGRTQQSCVSWAVG